MENISLDQVERQLELVRPIDAPLALREAVLANVHRELRASRWDRRLAQAAAILLVVGVGLNAAMGLGIRQRNEVQVAGRVQRDSLVQVAVSVAEATDARTGRLLARQLASRSGWPLSSEQAATIDAALDRQLQRTTRNGRDG